MLQSKYFVYVNSDVTENHAIKIYIYVDCVLAIQIIFCAEMITKIANNTNSNEYYYYLWQKSITDPIQVSWRGREGLLTPKGTSLIPPSFIHHRGLNGFVRVENGLLMNLCNVV